MSIMRGLLELCILTCLCRPLCLFVLVAGVRVRVWVCRRLSFPEAGLPYSFHRMQYFSLCAIRAWFDRAGQCVIDLRRPWPPMSACPSLARVTLCSCP